jgi:hypothetical protein
MKESSLTKFNKEKNGNLQIQGITGKQMEVKGQVKLNIENTFEPLNQTCYVVDSLPKDLDIILGQDWSEYAGYGFQKKTPIVIPACSNKMENVRERSPFHRTPNPSTKVNVCIFKKY